MRPSALTAVIIGALGLGACVTPSIPIPPPDPTEMTFDIQASSTTGSYAVFSYPPNQNYKDATVYVFDVNNGGGVFHVANPDDSFGPLQPLPAAAGDQVNVAIESADQTISRCIILRQGTQDPNSYCPGI
jgi:hypothetical protein